MVQVPTDNWILVFRVNLVATNVASGTDDHAAVMKAIGTKSPSDYRITRSEMDLRSTSCVRYIAIIHLTPLQPLLFRTFGTLNLCMVTTKRLT